MANVALILRPTSGTKREPRQLLPVFDTNPDKTMVPFNTGVPPRAASRCATGALQTTVPQRPPSQSAFRTITVFRLLIQCPCTFCGSSAKDAVNAERAINEAPMFCNSRVRRHVTSPTHFERISEMGQSESKSRVTPPNINSRARLWLYPPMTMKPISWVMA